MAERLSHAGLDKRKVCVFLILVAVGILCLGVLVYVLFNAKPHSNPAIQNGGHSLIRPDTLPFLHAGDRGPAVRS
ncbi:MAG TPA: hypothetical protein VGM02_11185 [Acidobacteriaceae bacterium]|jgi:hypothetical protein